MVKLDYMFIHPISPHPADLMLSDSGNRVPKLFPATGESWLTAKEAADYLRLPSTAAVYALNARRELKYHRVGKRRIRYDRRDLDQFLAGEVIAAIDPVLNDGGVS